MIGATRVKICGITRRDDAERAVDLGADAIGFVFWAGSPRVVSPSQARAIAEALPPFVTRVGVFVHASPEEIAGIAASAGLDAVQLHGDEAVDAYRAIGRRLIKGVALEDEGRLAAALVLPADVMPLVDAAAGPALRGGTGRTADWDRAARLSAGRRVMLAGGLTGANVADAVRRVRPWAVDVSSGVEDRPGIKSPRRLREFFAGLEAVVEDL